MRYSQLVSEIDRASIKDLKKRVISVL
jgi:hypothetical protein